ncbi:MAG: hypothetical protein J6I60_00080 [Bacteroidaceae bacterium]|jgi:hypothetical protein|nr:hypothetical protein [Bacteroidaceae bacterium]
MSFLSNLFRRKSAPVTIGGMEDYMMLVRVYFQASMAGSLGLSNMAMFPDLRMFKTKLRVPTQNNKLGPGEKAHCKKMLMATYDTPADFFAEIDGSLKKRCRKVQDVQTYMYQFQALSQDLMMLTTNLMKFKLRMPSIFKKSLYYMTEKTVKDIFHKNDYKDPGVVKAVMTVRQLDEKLGFSEKWITDYIYQIVMLAKKEKKPSA